jgi:dTDP-4-dehydrorhamnose reductase
MPTMRVVVTGASGQLGAYLIACLVKSEHEVIAWSGTARGSRSGLPLVPVDLTDAAAMRTALESANPDAVLHAAAVSAAADVLANPRRAWAVNVEATRRIGGWCHEADRRLVYISTDMVFDGQSAWNRETDDASPILEYGRTKRAGELVAQEVARGLIARVSLLFGRSMIDRDSYFDRSMSALSRGETQSFFYDEFRTPLHYRVAAEALVLLLESAASGIVHVGGRERLSRFELMRRAAGAFDYDTSLVRSNKRAEVPAREPRPADVSLDTSRLCSILPQLVRPPVEICARWDDR